jgi:hypothetical protein
MKRDTTAEAGSREHEIGRRQRLDWMGVCNRTDAK